ncbi:MAG: hypothetical protein K2Y40_16985 [Reyranella sp.]|nr:hypothetical protein [Reyranella sp.]
MATVDRKDLIRLLGELDGEQVAEILALKPALADVELAALWLSGQGDQLARRGQALTGTVAEIVDIVADDEEDDGPSPRPAAL